MIYKKDVIKIINDAQKDFELCWSILEIIKTSPKELKNHSELLISFQSVLAKQIYRLDVIGSRISKYLKANSDNKLMLKYRDYKEKIRLVSELGRSLGDAHAWMFYDNSRELLKKHMLEKRNPPFRETSGYNAEIGFIDKIKFINGYFVIYHGNTSILRLGDISIYCPKNKKVIGIAELKSKPIINKTCTVNVHFIVKEEGFDFIDSLKVNYEHSDQDFFLPGSEEARKRLERQIKKISESLKPKKNGSFQSSKIFLDLSELKNFFSISNTFSKIGETSIAVKYNTKHRKLSRFLFSKNHKMNFDGFIEEALKILNKEKKNNKLFIQHCHLSDDNKIITTPGIPPFFWYPLDLKILKKIYFLQTGIVTIYNAGVLENRLFSLGFEEQSDGKFIKRNGNKIIELSSLLFYHHLIKYHFVSIDVVITSIIKMIDGSIDSDRNRSIGLDFNLYI